jgi:hypothetical protein
MIPGIAFGCKTVERISRGISIALSVKEKGGSYTRRHTPKPMSTGNDHAGM